MGTASATGDGCKRLHSTDGTVGSSEMDTTAHKETDMTIQVQHIAKYVVYSLGLVATINLTLYEYFGTGFDQRSVNLTTEVVHVPIQATVEFANPAEADPFDHCGWDVVVELNESITLGTEVVLWGLNTEWDQVAFDEAYAAALVLATDDLEEGDTANPMDTGDFDTGSETEDVDTAITDTATQNDLSEPYELLNPEHQVFYETMRTFSAGEYAYRIIDDGTVKGPLFEDYASIVVHNSIRLLYYSQCGNVTDHFVITTIGEAIDLEATVTMVAHQGERISQPVGCTGTRTDYTNVPTGFNHSLDTICKNKRTVVFIRFTVTFNNNHGGSNENFRLGCFDTIIGMR